MLEPDRISYRPISIIGMLLILQVFGLVGLGAYEVLMVDWNQIDLDEIDSDSTIVQEQAAEAVLFIIFFLPPALLMFLAGLSFLLLKRRGWVLAAVSQGLGLGVCLFLYSEIQPWFIYPVMIYCILMILYLNSHDVRVIFHSRREPVSPGTEVSHEG